VWRKEAGVAVGRDASIDLLITDYLMPDGNRR